jgi:hypothetical protein
VALPDNEMNPIISYKTFRFLLVGGYVTLLYLYFRYVHRFLGR